MSTAVEEFNDMVQGMSESDLAEVLLDKIEAIKEDELDPVLEREAVESISDFFLHAKVERLSELERVDYEEWLESVANTTTEDVPENPLTFFLEATAGRTWKQSVKKFHGSMGF